MTEAFSFAVRPLRLAAFAVLLGGAAACSTSQTLESAAVVTTPPPVSAPLSAKHAAIVVDSDTGRTLYESNSTQPRFPASLTKMMTIYMLLDAMERGRVNKATPIPVSAHAARQPPTKLGVRPGQSIPAEIAILALVTKSANDVAAAVGEFLGGSEEQFGAMMTAKARQLGMSGTVFRNASGLPDPQQHTTARDMAVLGIRLRRDFPQYYAYFSVQSFQFNGRTITGHNRLLKRIPGADGIKTGFIRDSGFNIVTSVTRGSKHLVGVVMGGDSGKARDDYAVALMEHYLPPAQVAPVSTAYAPAETGMGSTEEGSGD
jgi:D-alanyl-D-alanine carboxypeptidase